MELGLFTCGYQYTNIESAFIDAAAFGYDFIELWGGRPHAWAPDMDAGRVAQLRELSARYAVPIRVYTPEHNGYPYNYMLGDEGQWEDCMRYLARSMEVSSRLGASRTLISVGHGAAALAAPAGIGGAAGRAGHPAGAAVAVRVQHLHHRGGAGRGTGRAERPLRASHVRRGGLLRTGGDSGDAVPAHRRDHGAPAHCGQRRPQRKPSPAGRRSTPPAGAAASAAAGRI